MSKFVIKIESPQHLDSVWVALLKQGMIGGIHPAVDAAIRDGDSDTMVVRHGVPYFSFNHSDGRGHQQLILKDGVLVPKETPIYEGVKLGDYFRLVEGSSGFNGNVYMLSYADGTVSLMNIEAGKCWSSTHVERCSANFRDRVGDAAKKLLTGRGRIVWEKVNVDFTVSPAE